MIALGSDHAGYELKESIREYLLEKGIEFIDCGVYSESSADYPLMAKETCGKITDGKCDLAILCCGTGIGMAISANKIKGIRAASCSDYFSAKYTRLHNDANVLCLGGRIVGKGLANELVEVFLASKFEGGRHQRRVDLITDIENQ